jgi:hypothetical protein
MEIALKRAFALIVLWATLTSASTSMSAEIKKGPGLPLTQIADEKNGLVMLATEIAVLPDTPSISSKLSVQAIALVGNNGGKLASPMVALRFTTANPSVIWQKVKTLTISYGGEKTNFNAARTVTKLDTGLTAEILRVFVTRPDFEKIAKAGKFFVTVQGKSFEVNTWNSTGIRVLANRLSPSKQPKVAAARKQRSVPTQKVRLTSRQKQSVFASLKLLRKMSSATEVGLSLMEYRDRLIDTKSDIDEVLRTLPQNKVRMELQASLDAYVDAGTLWSSSIQWDRRQSFSQMNSALLRKYSIPATMSHKTFDEMGGELTQGDKMFTLNVVWLYASIHMKAAEALIS